MVPDSLGQYKILERIGAGRIGDVYRARDTRLGRTVAVKVVSPEIAGDAERRERFLADARAATALSHPNVAVLYEVGEDGTTLYLAVEFAPGEPLTRLIAGKPLNSKRAVDFAIQIADALADAHAHGIVHRDIRPDNIVITPKGNAKILDFGLSEWTGGSAARQAAVAAASGHPPVSVNIAYLSPEQALGEAGDARTDIFSLGVVLFEMLTGTLPYGIAPADMLVRIVQAPAPAPSTMGQALPRELDAIVAKALAKSFDHRYESAAAMAAELRSVSAVLEVRTAAAGGVPPVAPVRRSEQSKSTTWIWILLVLGLVLGGLAVAWWIQPFKAL